MTTALPPGPKQPRVVQTVGWWARPHAYVERCRARYGKRFTLRLLGPPPMVNHSEPEHIKEIFTAPPEVLHPGAGARILEPVVGRHSVLLLDEREHMEQRRLMLPAFHGESIERLSDLMREVAEREAARWPSDESIELHPRLQALTLEIILRAVFGLDPGERLDELRSKLTSVLEFGNSPVSLLPMLQRDLGPLTPWANFTRLRAQADALIYELVSERRGEQAGDRDDILAMLLGARHEDGSPMSDQEVRDELMTLLVAGHETTASELAWAFERLARTPDVLARLVEEVDRDDEQDAYLTATIHETLRRRPVLPIAAPRLVEQPVEIGGWKYQPGVCMVANAYLLHHDPDVYPDPYAFRPERFLEEQPGTYTWIPFGGGRRRCLGASFAIVEMKVVLRAILSRSHIRSGATGLELTRRRAITVSPRLGARIILRERAAVVA